MKTGLILAGLLLFGVGLQAATIFAKRDSRPHMVPIESRQQPYLETGPEPATIGKPSSESSSALGFFMSPGLLLETTDYDLQSNARQQRQIGVGSDGRVHFDWTWKAVGGALGTRSCHYRSWTSGGGFTDVVDVSDQVGRTPGRFVALDVFGVKAVPIWHYTKTSVITATTGAIDAGSGSGAFAVENPPADVINCQNIVCRGVAPAAWPGYIWPVVAVGKDASNNCIVHIVASEGNTIAGWSALAYFRGQGNATGFVPGMYGTCGMFVDSNSATAYDVAADPSGPGVVIAYPKARQGNRVNNDLGYRYSGDYGQNWGPVVNLTNYATGAKERAGEDASVLFDGRHCFHILWLGMPYDSVKSEVSDQECKLYHWTSCNPTCQSLVLDANNHDDNASTPAFVQNISKIGLTQCARTGPNPDDTLLYAVYTRYTGTTAAPDRSAKNYQNGEVYVSASSTWGETWGAPVNVTNTPTNGCVAPNCADDRYTSSARYCTDTLSIEYMEDLDAGSFVSNESSTADLMNPMLYLRVPCFGMTPYENLAALPSSVVYPFHAVVGGTANVTITLKNTGNVTSNWNTSIAYTQGPGSNWLALNPSSESVTAGCTDTASILLTASAASLTTETLYHADITFTYSSGSMSFVVPVDFYVFNSFFLPEDAALRTSTNQLNVNQAGRVASQTIGKEFSYFSDNSNYLFDGSLIIGRSRDDLSWLIYQNDTIGPTPDNPFGILYALSDLSVDSTSYTGYRKAWGKGVNRDSAVGFAVDYWAPKHIDSSDFYIAHFKLYKGPKPGPAVSGLTVAFAADWDIPSDTAVRNSAGSDASIQMLYQRGAYNPPNTNRFGAIAAFRDDGAVIPGGFIQDNSTTVAARGTFDVDDLWSSLQTTSGYSVYGGSPTDLHSVLIIGQSEQLNIGDTVAFSVILAGQRNGSLYGLQAVVQKARRFICDNVARNSYGCEAMDCQAGCGDADNNGGIDMSDAVFLVQYIFAGGPAPANICHANANGCGGVNVADPVFLVRYIFSGGPAPTNCVNNTDCSQVIAGNGISVGCPPYTVYHGASYDSVAIPIYISNTVTLKGYSLGFHYPSDNVEITSIAPSGTIPAPDIGGFQTLFKPSENKVLFGGVSLAQSISPQTNTLLATLYARILSGSPTQSIELDSAFVAPAGEFIFVEANGGIVRPEFDDGAPIVPVVLVHGWNSGPGIWGDNNGGMISWLKQDNISPYLWTIDLDKCGHVSENSFDYFGLHPERMFAGNAELLSDQIENSIHSLPSEVQQRITGIDIIAHSMGGLVARRYQQRRANDNWFIRPVRRLIMLGTPNGGTDVGGPKAELVCYSFPKGRAGEEMSERNMQAFNAPIPVGFGYTGPGDFTQYSVIFGTGPCFNGTEYYCNEPMYWVTAEWLQCNHDGLVEEWSAIGKRDQSDAGTAAYTRNWPASYCHSSLYAEKSIYDVYIKPILSGIDPAPSILASRNLDPMPLKISYSYEDSLSSGQSVSRQILVESNSHIFFTLFSNDSVAQLSLISPSSTVYDSSTFLPDSSEYYFNDRAGGQLIYIENAEPGQWTWAINASGATSPMVNFEIRAHFENGVQVFKSQSLQYPSVTDTLVLNVVVKDAGVGATGLSVTATPIWNESDTLNEVMFFDDGLHGDQGAADGVYGAKVTSFMQGSARFETSVNGNLVSGLVSRNLAFFVYSPRYSCGDANGDAAVDISDAVSLIAYIFSGGPAPAPLVAGDANCDQSVDISDAVYLIGYIFAGGPPPCEGC